MKTKNYLVIFDFEDGFRSNEMIMAGSPQSAYNKWRKTSSGKNFVRVEDMNGVVFDVHFR